MDFIVQRGTVFVATGDAHLVAMVMGGMKMDNGMPIIPRQTLETLEKYKRF
jgi:hypothetical protein